MNVFTTGVLKNYPELSSRMIRTSNVINQNAYYGHCELPLSTKEYKIQLIIINLIEKPFLSFIK
jgi:hypothetical protein